MIENFRLSYDHEGYKVTLTADNDDPCGDYTNFPYTLANMVAKIIDDADINSDIVIENLISAFGYENEKNK